MTRLELTISGLFLLGLISYLIAFRAHTDQTKPVAEARAAKAAVEPQTEKRDLPRPRRGVGPGETPVPASQMAIARNDVSSEQDDATAESDAAIPVAFFDPSPELSSNEGQPAEIDFLRQQFVELMGESDQDPSSPEYRRRWDEAQRQIDEEFMAFFGQEAFNEQQGKAVRAAGQASGSLF